MSVGRNTDELVRMITALQLTAREKVSTPANWKEGKDVLVKTPPKTDGNSSTGEIAGYHSPAWFLWFKKSN